VFDWGPDRLTASQRRDLMEIIEDRYGRGSTLITSQLPVEAWHEVIGDPTFADAILTTLTGLRSKARRCASLRRAQMLRRQ
jgi:DNA replication protein DnaC